MKNMDLFRRQSMINKVKDLATELVKYIGCMDVKCNHCAIELISQLFKGNVGRHKTVRIFFGGT